MEPLYLHDIENGQPRGAGDGVAPEGAEELHAVGEGGGDRLGRHDGGQREAVPDRLAEDDDVRNDRLRLEPPEMRAQSSESDLDLVGDADPAGGPDMAVGLGEIAAGKDDLPGDARQGLGDEGGQAAPGPGLRGEAPDGRGVFWAGLGVVPPEGPPVTLYTSDHLPEREGSGLGLDADGRALTSDGDRARQRCRPGLLAPDRVHRQWGIL